MRKILYNKWLKMAAALVLAVLTVLLSVEMLKITDILQEYKDRVFEEEEKAEEKFYGNLGALEKQELNNVLETFMGEGGWQAVRDTYFSSATETDYIYTIIYNGEYVTSSGWDKDDYYAYFDEPFEPGFKLFWLTAGSRIVYVAYQGQVWEIHGDYYDEVFVVPVEGAVSEKVAEWLKTEGSGIAAGVSVRGSELLSQAYSEAYENKAEQLANYERNLWINNRELLYDCIKIGIAYLFLLIYLTLSCGRVPEGKKKLNGWDKAWTELHMAFIAAAGLGVIALYGMGVYGIDFNDYSGMEYYDRLMRHLSVAAMSLFILIIFHELGVLLKKRINRCFFKDFALIKLFVCMKNRMAKIYQKTAYTALPEIRRLYMKRVMMDVLMGLFILISLFTLINVWDYYYNEEMIALLLIFLAGVTCFYVILSVKEYKHLRLYNKIVERTRAIHSGDYENGITDEEESNETLLQLAGMSKSMEESVRRQVAAEKMKVELIANVSHDLKTPLTSIISYVDLLQQEEMSEAAKDYVNILDEKSARLKSIVSDVFDLTKATGGEQVEMETLDGAVLLNQVLSDMNDRIESSGRELRVSTDEQGCNIMGNGQKLYRVFQNTMDNALKYSLRGTRIYIQSVVEQEYFTVTIKNIAEYEMDFTKQEILERFTRGDKARHSEGNGLGLSIAESFTKLCGGVFDIEIDGDMFKVIVKLKRVH